MFVGKYSKYLICKSLSNRRNPGKIKENGLKKFEPRNNSLGLGDPKLQARVLQDDELSSLLNHLESATFVRHSQVLILMNLQKN
jgi:hypothetical protein